MAHHSEKLSELVDILDRFIEFIRPFEALLDTHNVQFIHEEHWTNEKILRPDLRDSLNDFVRHHQQPDDSSAASPVVNLVQYYSTFQASKAGPFGALNELLSQLHEFHRTWNERVLTDMSELECLDQAAFSPESDAEFSRKFNEMGKQNRFMNQKKIYEVDTMSIVVAKLCKKQGINTIVDIGSGKAYLSAQLSSPLFNFNVIAIDSSVGNVESSMKRLNVMKRKTKVFASSATESASTTQLVDDKSSPSSFQTFSQFIQSSTELNELIRSSIGSNFEGDADYALIGLHSCGNLSNSIINLYLANNHRHGAAEPSSASSNAANFKKLLCNVACCYNLLNEKYANDAESHKDLKRTNVNIDESSKFPMSRVLNQRRYCLGFNLRMLACHSLDRSICNLGDFKELNNVVLWYRCVLESILLDHSSSKASTNDEDDNELDASLKGGSMQIGRKLIKEKTTPTFIDYVRKAFERLAINDELLSDEKIMEYWNKHAHLKMRFDVYLQLKLIIAPIIEYIILLDRLIYLFEHRQTSDLNYKHHLVRIFDPAKSPRCHALISTVD